MYDSKQNTRADVFFAIGETDGLCLKESVGEDQFKNHTDHENYKAGYQKGREKRKAGGHEDKNLVCNYTIALRQKLEGTVMINNKLLEVLNDWEAAA